MCKSSYYFKHDYGAGEDEKLLRVRMDHGSTGYGIYFLLLELLCKSDNGKYQKNIELIAYALREEKIEVVQSVIEDYGLFEFEGGDGTEVFYSQRLLDNMPIGKDGGIGEKSSYSERATKASNARWSKHRAKHDANDAKHDANDAKHDANDAKHDANDALYNRDIDKEEENSSSLRSELSLSSTSDEASELTEEDIDDAPPIEIDRKPKIGMAWVLPLWAEICPHLAQPKKLDADRVRALNARAREANAKTAEEFQQVLREMFQRVADSDFLSGRTEKNFRATFDWLVKHKGNWQKVDEGNYTNNPHQHTHIPHYATPPNLVATTPSIAAHEAFQQERREQIYTEVLADARRVASENAAC